MRWGFKFGLGRPVSCLSEWTELKLVQPNMRWQPFGPKPPASSRTNVRVRQKAVCLRSNIDCKTGAEQH